MPPDPESKDGLPLALRPSMEVEAECPSPLLTPDAVCALLKISRKNLYRLVARREVPFLKISRHLRFAIADVQAWLQQVRMAVSKENFDDSQASERKVDR